MNKEQLTQEYNQMEIKISEELMNALAEAVSEAVAKKLQSKDGSQCVEVETEKENVCIRGMRKLAKHYQVGFSTVFRLVEAGRLPAHRYGVKEKHYLFYTAETDPVFGRNANL